jgi:hypothetical protein
MIQFSAPLTPARHDPAEARSAGAGPAVPEHAVASITASAAAPAATRALRQRIIAG